jgi:O-acetyl-ADP-ribose deacetylase (regulator of RNase III)
VSASIRELYYITHVDNLQSILERGILSHERVIKENVKYTPIYDEQIVLGRRDKKAPDGRSLWSFANLYFKARNAMLYRVIIEKSAKDIVVLGIRRDVLNRSDIFVTTGNAASAYSEILPVSQLKRIEKIVKRILKMDYWTMEDGTKRETMAECLVPDSVSPEYIQTIYVADRETMNKVKEKLQWFKVEVVCEPSIFFQPNRKYDLTPNLSLVDGDMFFSRMQTLTISVNTVGIMGKGLASRAKYFFPDLYVHYQDLCRRRILEMGKPFLYKRESSLDYQLADEPETLRNANLETWFLLFPTKRHWRDRADIDGIEKGLQWLRDNYKKLGIKCLAVPALGCGLGQLDWRDVGPLLVKCLSTLDIPVQVYLPMEKPIPEELLSKEFLLRKN